MPRKKQSENSERLDATLEQAGAGGSGIADGQGRVVLGNGTPPEGTTVRISDLVVVPVEQVPLADLKPHPRNYREHPDDQIEHLAQSIRQNGFYRNIVVARDNTILAGHGVALAAGRLGMLEVPVVRLPIDPDCPAALKVLTGDNEIEHLAEQDDRLLSELLKEIKEVDLDGLLGTGYDEAMLANLVFVTRPAGEIEDFDEAAHWVGMPEYHDGEEPLKLKAGIDLSALPEVDDYGLTLRQVQPVKSEALKQIAGAAEE